MSDWHFQRLLGLAVVATAGGVLWVLRRVDPERLPTPRGCLGAPPMYGWIGIVGILAAWFRDPSAPGRWECASGTRWTPGSVLVYSGAAALLALVAEPVVRKLLFGTLSLLPLERQGRHFFAAVFSFALSTGVGGAALLAYWCAWRARRARHALLGARFPPDQAAVSVLAPCALLCLSVVAMLRLLPTGLPPANGPAADFAAAAVLRNLAAIAVKSALDLAIFAVLFAAILQHGFRSKALAESLAIFLGWAAIYGALSIANVKRLAAWEALPSPAVLSTHGDLLRQAVWFVIYVATIGYAWRRVLTHWESGETSPD